MRRREFIAGTAATAATGFARPTCAHTNARPTGVRRLAIFHPVRPPEQLTPNGGYRPYRVYFEELNRLGYIEGQNIAELKHFGKVTVTTAHEAYSNSTTREALGVTVHKLSVRAGPELYRRVPYADKKQMLVVSHDDHPLKEQVLQLIARGYRYKEIAARLHLSVKTVESHVSAVLRKLQLSSRHELTRWAAERRLI